jgi:peptidoglycan/LPS O-acetylase OafA/YrhL
VLASWPGTDIAVIVILAALLLASAYYTGLAFRLLELPPFQFLGNISYSLYMVQVIAGVSPLAIARLFGIASPSLSAIAMAALSFAVAVPLSKYFEYPMRRMIRDWASGDLAAKPGEAERPRQAS